jgi:hypothetical protein
VFGGYHRARTDFRSAHQKGLILNMAETPTSTKTPTGGAAKSTGGTTRKPAARKPAARKSTTTRSRSTSRSPAAKAPSRSTGRRNRTIARNETREAASAQARAAKTTAAQGRNVAERAALVYVGATLEARDRVVGAATGIADRFGSRTAAEREVSRDIKRFERRGHTARNQLERDVRKARTRLEREVRTRRRDAEKLVRRNRRAVEREAGAAEREADRRSNIVSARLAMVSNRVEDAAQFGVAAGSRIATAAKDRVTALV